MTFARSVKEELTRIDSSKSMKLAELSALLHLSGEVVYNKEGLFIEFTSSNIAITRRFVSLVKDLYDAEVELFKKEGSNLKKSGMLVIIKSHTKQIVSEHSLLEENTYNYDLLTASNEEKQAYLKGAFLASGSVNDPIKPNYHLEIFTKSKNEAIYVQRLMNHFDLNARITKRRNGLIIYIKEAEAISEFLKVIGAYDSVFNYEDLRIQRDFNNSINRVINCEIANEKKTLDAANNQLSQIKLIKQYKDIDSLDSKTREIILLREENPNSSLNELATAYEQKTGDKMSKSGINHRLVKIRELALDIVEQIKEGQ
ncbi:MAG: DNA-binding protein WhiA [Acholeplasmataceae bacterium]|jgi:DNA-binding protein WhiA|nr:DNA-binding protein WhiA [Acholeplasmataceae bacterium]MDD4204310.1 DNA-binding protein WhiA [Acholeplasmataceae bacterium]MDD4469283.1 DNA-binding protein WhiA [Acholeplasmataceae bacterium]